MTLTEFLLARIAEDEADVAEPAAALHFAPARVLAECEAKRQIVEFHRPEGEPVTDLPGMDYEFCLTCHETGPEAQAWPCDTLRALATPYADHLDYRQEWAV